MAIGEDISEFLENLLSFGLEYYGKYYSVYRAEVTRNDDPEKRGRIQAHVPGSIQDSAPDIWIDPSFVGAGQDRGFVWPPEIGDSVQVFFEQGNSSRPCLYLGGWYGAPASLSGQSEVPAELAYGDGQGATPSRRGFVTRMGHTLVFDDAPGNEMVRITWHRASDSDPARTDPTLTANRSSGDTSFITLNASGVQIQSSTGAIVFLDDSGNIRATNSREAELSIKGNFIELKTSGTIALNGAKVDLTSGPQHSAVLGEPFLSWARTHTHPTPMGPSGSPIQPIPASVLSKKVRLS